MFINFPQALCCCKWWTIVLKYCKLVVKGNTSLAKKKMHIFMDSVSVTVKISKNCRQSYFPLCFRRWLDRQPAEWDYLWPWDNQAAGMVCGCGWERWKEEGEVRGNGLRENTQDGSGSSWEYQKTRGMPGIMGTVTYNQRIPHKRFLSKNYNTSSPK